MQLHPLLQVQTHRRGSPRLHKALQPGLDSRGPLSPLWPHAHWENNLLSQLLLMNCKQPRGPQGPFWHTCTLPHDLKEREAIHPLLGDSAAW